MPFATIRRLALGAIAAAAFCGPALSSAHAAENAPLLSGIFSDHMVLQRGEPIRVWGHANARERLTVKLGRKSKQVRADAQGKWSAEFGALKKGGPLSLSIKGASGAEQTLSDILIGDVFLCSGQSNMEMQVSGALNAYNEINGAYNDTIRIVTISRDSAAKPKAEFETKPQWAAVSPQTIGNFSAVCYYTARELQKHHDVPMGLISSSWGGSQIEAWISREGLEPFPAFKEDLDLLSTYASNPKRALEQFGVRFESWWKGASPNDPNPWKDDGGEEWKAVPRPMQDYRRWDDPAAKTHTGMIWFRTSFELTPEQAAQGGTFALGGMDEVDYTWVNGGMIGSTFGWGDARSYAVDAGALVAGENVLTVNVLNSWGAGGMYGPEDQLVLTLADGSKIALNGEWVYKIVPRSVGTPPRSPWQSIVGLTGLHNAMIAPLDGAKFKGAIWYQGESNADRADQYEGLLGALASNWRGLFGKDLPLMVVQLPGFGALASEPVNSGWARLREGQRRAAEADPKMGLVVTIDAGDRWDIHPPNKQAVGRRAAHLARALVYGEDLAPSGPKPGQATYVDNSVVVAFEDVTGDLVAMSFDKPIAFELCNADGSGCRYADAVLEGGAVRLLAEGGNKPGLVRYCWADTPICNLYDGAGQPLVPFEVEID